MNNNRRNNQPDPNTRDFTTNRVERNSSIPNDLPDSENDRKELQQEESFIDLPDVKDIPGQEFVNAPPPEALGDTTISSDDEEGTGVFDENETENLGRGTDAAISRDERITLENVDYMPTKDEDNLYQASMDDTDFEGEQLNEKSFGKERSGDDLDVPGAEEDNRDEQAGSEDEENNEYSLGNPKQ